MYTSSPTETRLAWVHFSPTGLHVFAHTVPLVWNAVPGFTTHIEIYTLLCLSVKLVANFYSVDEECKGTLLNWIWLPNITERAMAPHSNTLAWKILWTEEPGGLQSMGSRRVGHDWATSLSLFTFMHWRRKWQPTPVFLPGESQGQGSLVSCRL